ncbi:TPA: hypothetical protein ACH3X3_008327 [Trebouxia sp. C0006]
MAMAKPTPVQGTSSSRGWFVISRATFWILWALSTLVSTAFAVLALISFVQMHRVHNTANFTGGRQIRGPMAAEFFGAVAVVFTNALALITLLWKTARRDGTGFWYGYVVASYGITGLWLVLSGIVMWAGNEKSLWNTTSHWGHGVSVAYDVAFVLAWVTAGIYLLTWAMLFFFRRTFSRPAAVVHDTEAGMSSAYPAANTYTSPAFANSPRAATTTAPRSWFARKPATAAGPLTAGAAAAAATSTATSDHTGSVPVSTSNPVGPLETATRTPAQTAAPSSYGAFTQHNGHQRSDSSPAQEQSMQAVPEAAAEAPGARNVVYARESEMGPVGPSGATGAFGPSQANNTNGALYNDNKAGFFQSA